VCIYIYIFFWFTLKLSFLCLRILIIYCRVISGRIFATTHFLLNEFISLLNKPNNLTNDDTRFIEHLITLLNRTQYMKYIYHIEFQNFEFNNN